MCNENWWLFSCLLFMLRLVWLNFELLTHVFVLFRWLCGVRVENSDQWKSIRREKLFFLKITHTTKVVRFASFSSSNWRSCATDLYSSSSSWTFWCHGPRYMALCEKTLHTSPLMTKHVFEQRLTIRIMKRTWFGNAKSIDGWVVSKAMQSVCHSKVKARVLNGSWRRQNSLWKAI